MENAWEYFTHDQARSRAYHWDEDGLAGISDQKQRLCFSVGLWNGKDAMRSDDGAKKNLYGKNLGAKEIVRQGEVSTAFRKSAANDFDQGIPPLFCQRLNLGAVRISWMRVNFR
jgi:hypothetical protein